MKKLYNNKFIKKFVATFIQVFPYDKNCKRETKCKKNHNDLQLEQK